MLHDAPAKEKAKTPENISSSSDTNVEDYICHLPLSIIVRPFPPALFLAMLDIASEKKLSL